MSAAELRQASETLRERAEDANPGPWIAGGNAVRIRNGMALALTHDTRWDDSDADQKRKDARYIATMHPGVGLALADWLDAMAAVWDGDGKYAFGSTEQRALAAMDAEPDPTSLGGRAFALARLINGGAA